MASGENISYILSVVPGTMTGFASLNAGLASINNAFLQLTGAIDQSVGLVNSMLITTGVVATQVATDAMNAFGEFEQSMKIVQMVSGQTADQISFLSQKANEFSIQYRMDIDQITEGLQTLGRAGLNTASEQAEVLQNGLNTAKLEGRDLNAVLQELIQNTALLGGNLKSSDFGEQSEYVNDLLVSTSMTAPITTHDISETLKYSGGIAAAAGANIESDEGKRILEDYMGAIAAFAQKGVTGSIAGTALRAFFNKPATQDSSVVEALESIGLTAESLWQDGGEKMKPVSEQIGLIKSRMEELNISTMDQLQIWSKIVGGKMGQQMMKLDSDDIKVLTADIREANDAETLAANSMKTFQSNVKEIGEAGAAAFRNFGAALVFFVNPLLNALKPVMELLNNDFMSWPLAIGFIGFISYVGKKIFEVFRILKTEISSIWSLYKSGGITTFKDWRDNVLGPKYGYEQKDKQSKDKDETKSQSKSSSTKSSSKSKEPTSLNDIAKNYRATLQKETMNRYMNMGLTEKELTGIKQVQTWTKYNANVGMSDSKALTAMIVNRVMPKEMLTDLADHSMNKQPFMNKYGIEKGNGMYLTYALQLKEVQQALQQASSATKEETVSEKNNTKTKEQNTIVTNEAVQAAKIYSNTITGLIETENLWVEESRVATEQITLSFNEMWANMIRTVNSGFNTLTLGEKFRQAGRQARMNRTEKERYEKEYEESLAKDNALQEKYRKQQEKIRTKNLDRLKAKDSATQYARYYETALKHQQGAYIVDRNPVYSGTANIGDNYNRSVDALRRRQRTEKMKVQDDEALNRRYSRAVKKNVQGVDSLNHYYKRTVEAELERQRIIEQELITERTIAEARASEQTRIQARNSSGVVGTPLYGEDGSRFREDAKNQVATNTTNAYIRSQQSTPSHVIPPTQEEEAKKTQKELEKTQKEVTKTQKSITTLAKGQQNAAAQAAKLNQERIKNEEAALFKNSEYWKANTKHSIAAANKAAEQGSLPPGVVPTTWRDKWRKGAQGFKDTVSSSVIGNMGTYLHSTWNEDRTGKFLNFGASRLGRTFNGVANIGGKLINFAGGPFMVAMMGITTAIQIVENAYKQHSEEVKKAGDKLADAYSKLESAEDKLEESLKDANPGATSDEINEMVYDTYAQITDDMQNHVQDYINKVAPKAADLGTYEYDEEADDGSMKKVEEEKNSAEAQTDAINENTSALYAATAELSLAMDQYVRKGRDSIWGIDAFGTTFSDSYGKILDFVLTGGEGSKFTDANSFLLTASQQDENYAGYTEMAGLMLEDFKDANGDWIAGLRRMMGQSVYDFAQIIPEDSRSLLNNLAQFSKGLGTADNLRLQQSMKRDTKTWQKLAKEIAKEENKTKKSVTEKVENKKIQGLIAKLQATMGAGFNKTQILQGAYLQQMQDMYSIAQSVMTPLIAQNAQSSAQNLLATQGVRATTNGTGASTYNTASITSVIAGYVAMIAQQSAKDATYDYAINMNPKTDDEKWFHDKAMEAQNADAFYKELKKADEGGNFGWFNEGALFKIGHALGLATNHYGMDQYLKIYGSTAYQTAYGMSPDAANKRAEEYVKQARAAGNVTSTDILNTLAKNYQSGQFKDALLGAYLASDLGEDKDSGSSSGSGSGDSDKDSGTKTKKERVDLVLCNKKEIPKLNVNLFKKAPSFTVLNKNFKLRDIKVNTEDKPKAILSSIKNAIIDVQKRSDPKIIQDESAEYDPVAATDGSSVPTGSTSTSTDG